MNYRREYFIELAALAIFMMSAAVFGSLLEHPDSFAHRLAPDPVIRRVLMGTAMGLTAAALIYSPWGRRSGAHMNPSVTLAFLRLGTIAPRDALFYVMAQFVGGVLGIAIASLALDDVLAHPAVNYVATRPGTGGVWGAFTAEAAISFALMVVVLTMSNTPRLSRFTGVAVAMLLTAYITFVAPVSGMSMNPARTLGSEALAGGWSSIWIYFVAPPLGMLGAAEAWRRLRPGRVVRCAKLQHDSAAGCSFRCRFDQMPGCAQPSHL